VRVDVRLNDIDIKAGIAALQARFPPAIRRALKRAGTSGRSTMTKLIAEDMGIAQKKVRPEIKVETGDLFVRLTVSGGRLNLIEFSARGPEPSRGKGGGVSYRLPQGRGRVPNAFIATMKSGHRGVFVRRPDARAKKTSKGWTQLPIVELKGPSLVKVFNKRKPEGQARAAEALLKNVAHEVQWALSQSKR
jgi:hypothetical protein